MGQHTVSEKTGLLEGTEKKQCEWTQSAVVIVASMLGTGVLGLPLALKQTGWVLGLSWLCLAALLSVYSGLLLGRLYRAGSGCKTYADLAYEVCHRRYGHNVGAFARSAVMFLAYSYMFGVCCIFVTAMKISIQELVTTVHMSDVLWLLLTLVFIYPFVQMQSLHEASFISLLGVATIIVVVAMVVAHVVPALFGYRASALPAAVGQLTSAEPRSAVVGINGLTTIAFAFGGHVIFLEVISEMRNSKDFSKTVFSSQTAMFLNYIVVAGLGYLAYGSTVKSPVTMNLHGSYRVSLVAHLCLLVHVLVAYCIESYVIVSALQLAVRSRVQNIPSCLSGDKVRWAVLSALVLVCAGAVSLLVPSFGDLMSLYSSLGICSLSFSVPPLLWIIYNYENMSKPSLALHMMFVAFGASMGICGLFASAQTIFLNMRMRVSL
mmetsp:Transcript_11549/g.35303  ORF Transcript_11549/g.35303 Transcript_11549/m.35303 type:complete len:435 (+) Transcript_11549:323-1627(+)|eukprot:CAMPEP_0198731184 /NCGR_PEP_ID=MMETSP1475-20131203/28565_1 /TAXON_ID= ORGANISM="Unidentified sp., Strain CCMP1999" /NCGR_SAMPLE_ID=MMETSP1475 /ASSEMBLY_ACC=CAM_ASM_001111 /LENGTH=434 /DNA_ID=CAMNT_0044494113 /DNA_START=204 /DNA_END=1508 /DNA_ORIENTATION=-